MTTPVDVRFMPAPLPARGGRSLLRWVCTSNPFYVVSAALFLFGLYLSFGAQTRDVETWALMSGLGGYTLLLAVTACLLVRFGNVWDDVRTVLLLVVLMFLATSVTFDEVLVLDPRRGFLCYLGGLIFAVVVTEGLLRGIRLRLRAWFRVPYYLILALFFLYPLALSPFVRQPRSEQLVWGLFGFSSLAALFFLTLLPAIRRGAAYVRDNGSPWPWPLYPWTLFGILGLAVPARAFLLCWSMHLLDAGDRDSLIFGPYFLVPFGLALGVLLLDGGLVSGRRGVLAAALAVPVGLVVLAVIGHRTDAVYQGFLQVFTARLGGDPLHVTLLAAGGFYVYAGLRGTPLATEALTAALVALAVVGPDMLQRGEFVEPRPLPILAAAVLQLVLGIRQRNSGRCFAAAAGLVLAATMACPGDFHGLPLRETVASHLALVATLTIGALFRDFLARMLQLAGAGLVLVAAVVVFFADYDPPATMPRWMIAGYPLILALLLAVYGLLLRHRTSQVVAGLVLVCSVVAVAWQGYTSMREDVPGLDYISLSLAFFALAVLVSLIKSGALSRWVERRRQQPAPTSG
jgi:hypothetical protein